MKTAFRRLALTLFVVATFTVAAGVAWGDASLILLGIIAFFFSFSLMFVKT